MSEIWRYRGAAATVALAAALVAVGLPAAANAQPGNGDEPARVTVYANGVDFAPNVQHRGAILTVSGNGNTYRYETPTGLHPSIGLFDPDGQLLADGRYTWRLELVPDAETAAALRAAAEENGGEAPTPWAAQSGAFTIENGAFADPGLTEPTARRATRAAASGPPLAAASGVDRGPADDEDATVGPEEGYEARMNAAAARQTPPAARGVLVQGDPVAGDDADATAAALGRSLEAGATDQMTPRSRGAFAPRPRSDGSNGRPRSQ